MRLAGGSSISISSGSVCVEASVYTGFEAASRLDVFPFRPLRGGGDPEYCSAPTAFARCFDPLGTGVLRFEPPLVRFFVFFSFVLVLSCSRCSRAFNFRISRSVNSVPSTGLASRAAILLGVISLLLGSLADPEVERWSACSSSSSLRASLPARLLGPVLLGEMAVLAFGFFFRPGLPFS